MALIKCPDCGRDISDQARMCIHCGRPMTPDLSRVACALVLSRVDNSDPTLTPLIQELCGCSQEKAEALRTQAPVPLLRRLPYGQCVEMARRFQRGSVAEVYRDEDADALSIATPLYGPGSVTEKPFRPLNFWQTAGAFLTALFLFWLVVYGFLGLPT